MPGIEIFFPVLLDNRLHLIGILDMMCKSQELTPFLSVVSFSNFLGYGEERVDMRK